MRRRCELLVMRHGEAEDWADGGDAARVLTSRGRAMARRAGALLRAADLVPSVAIASPFVRAQQTLHGVLEAAGPRVSTSSEPRLTPGTPSSLAIDALLEAAALSSGRLLAVSHNPCVTELLSSLVGGPERMCFAVSVGDIAHLSVDPRERSAVLLGFMPARVLCALNA